MEKDLHKRLEKEKHKYAYMLTPMFSLHYSEEYGRVATAFMRGAELGYKEAIAQAKEWMKENARHYSNTVIGRRALLADFETGMNKLWEESK